MAIREILDIAKEGIGNRIPYCRKIVNFVNDCLNNIDYELIHEGPVNLESICTSYGINIEYLEFDDDNSNQSRILGRLVLINYENKGKQEESSRQTTIYIEKNSSYNVKRYTLAHELAHFLLHNRDSDLVYTDAQLSFPEIVNVEDEEIIADDIATVLLVPYDIFSEQIKDFKTKYESENDFDIDSFLMELSRQMQVPFYIVAYAYQFYRNYKQ